MNRLEQRKFVKTLGNNVIKNIVTDIAKGKVPEDWDGIELRQLLADRFDREVFKDLIKRRRREYNSDIITNNL